MTWFGEGVLETRSQTAKVLQRSRQESQEPDLQGRGTRTEKEGVAVVSQS